MTLKQSGKKSQQNETSLFEDSKYTVSRQMLKTVFSISVKIVLILLYICLQKMFTGFYNKTIYQFSCLKALYKISELRNYNSCRHSSFDHCSIKKIYFSNAARN